MPASFHPCTELRLNVRAPSASSVYGKSDKTSAWETARDMHRALGLLLLAAEGALAQSREPSQWPSLWDANVPGYSNVIIDGCPCNNTADCSPDDTVGVEQKGTSAAIATLSFSRESKPALKFAYLTDQDGTILDYKAGDTAWDGTGNTVIFTWDASKQPTGLVPHIVYNDSCADVTTSVVTPTWVRQGPPPTARTRSTMLRTP